MKRIKTIILITVFVIINQGAVVSQNLTSSPYSIFGVGEINSKGNSLNASMGGVGIGLKSGIGLNNINPASYSGIDSLFFIYELGVSTRYSIYANKDQEQKSISGNLSSFAIGFQAKKWWGVSVGLTPFSSVGYNINTINNMNVDNTVYQNTYIGSGGINQIYMGNSFRLSKNISLGINLSYLFGTFDEDEQISFNIEETSFTITDQNHVKGLYLDYGIQIDYPMNKNKLTFGAIYGHKRYLSSSTDRTIYDEINESYLYDEEGLDNNENYIIPRKFGIGVAFSKEDLFKVALDYTLNQWSEIEFSNSDLNTQDSHKMALGIEYSPEGRYSSKIFKSWYYRLGGYYNRSYLKINQNSINSMALTMGFGIPVKRNLSMLNIGFEIGKNGTLDNGLLQENFYKMNINFSLQDIWFLKQKIE